MSVSRILITAGFAVGWAGAAQADLKFCNETADVQSISIGYKGDDGWTSEGWWNADPGACVTAVSGELKQRYYYYRAEVNGGDFTGQNYFFCTTPSEYTIVGDTDCEARGYDREDFYEIDTGETAKDFTFTLVAGPGEAPVTPPPSNDTAELGLRVCNDTADIQAVSIGYEGEEGWTSEGWWNVQPNDCATVIGGALKKRYYYYRAEVNGGPFQGGGYNFCTTPQEYTIVGDSDCAARGYDSEDFAEVDVGAGTTGHTIRISGGASDVTTNDTPDTPDTPIFTPDTPPADTDPVATTAPENGLQICNRTGDVQGVSIGYEGKEGWTSEGWWNIEPGKCAIVIGGALDKQYYYYRAEVNGGPFPGGGYNFCTTPQEYTIVGDTNCEARGYDSEDFAEIDVGVGVTGFSFDITDAAHVDMPDLTVAPDPEPDTPVVSDPPAGDTTVGLRICNETSEKQGVSIGYEGPEGWTSEGWWNIDPAACANVLAGPLTKRYFYYRAEVDGGPFEGGGYYFCTTPKAYTIVGDTNCEARGHDREDFAEIDIGPDASSFVFTITGGAPIPDVFEETTPTPTPPETVEPPKKPEPESKPQPKPKPESVATPEPEPEPEPEADPQPEPEADPMLEEEPKKPTRRGSSRG